MQPEQSAGMTPGPERQPQPPVNGGEAIPRLPPIDARFERGQERFEQAGEAGARASDAAAVASAVAAPVAPAPPPVMDPGISATSAPLVAADEDLIEKEWVDKAKEIIEATKDDPHARTDRVNALQREYLQKRYGKVVGANE